MLKAPSTKYQVPSLRSLTVFLGSAYIQLAILKMTRKLNYCYWCACTSASPSGEAVGRNLRVRKLI